MSSSVVIRPSHESDAPVLHRLAQLDSAAAPRGQMLLAEVDGVLRAAYSKRDGTILADPFYPSRALVTLLEAHAHGDSGETRWAHSSRALASLRRRAPWPA